jgi:hypothetical protein
VGEVTASPEAAVQPSWWSASPSSRHARTAAHGEAAEPGRQDDLEALAADLDNDLLPLTDLLGRDGVAK